MSPPTCKENRIFLTYPHDTRTTYTNRPRPTPPEGAGRAFFGILLRDNSFFGSHFTPRGSGNFRRRSERHRSTEREKNRDFIFQSLNSPILCVLHIRRPKFQAKNGVFCSLSPIFYHVTAVFSYLCSVKHSVTGEKTHHFRQK